MGVREESKKLHDSGFNCGQSVLGACAEYSGLDHLTAMNVAGCLGGGVRCGEICGAVSGGAMVLSCAFPHNDSERPDDKTALAEKIKKFTQDFKAEYGYIRCNDLKMNEVSCEELIQFCAELAENSVKKYKAEENI